MDGRNHRLRRCLERFDHHRYPRRTGYVRIAELGDVRTGEEGPSLTVKHDGFSVFVALSHFQTVGESLPNMVAQGVNWGIVGGEDSNPIFDFIGNGLAQLFHLNPWETSPGGDHLTRFGWNSIVHLPARWSMAREGAGGFSVGASKLSRIGKLAGVGWTPSFSSPH